MLLSDVYTLPIEVSLGVVVFPLTASMVVFSLHQTPKEIPSRPGEAGEELDEKKSDL